MTAVRPRVHSNPIAACLYTNGSRAKNIGFVSSARISQCCNFIDIYAQFDHGKVSQSSIVSFMRGRSWLVALGSLPPFAAQESARV